MTGRDVASVLDVSKYPNARLFLERCHAFINEIKNLTPGKELEKKLNVEYGPGNEYYDDFCNYVRLGLEERWVAQTEIDGPNYRRGKIALPSPETHFFSITTVYMNSVEEYSGQYHAHPYGELNCVVRLDSTSELMGMHGWQGDGWTCPGPGTHHYPQVRGGALVALFFLPGGRISYEASPASHQSLTLDL